MATWEDSEGQTRSSLNVVQRMSIPVFSVCFHSAETRGGNKTKIQSNTPLGTLEVLKRPDNGGHSDESH
jgi:hypothetical protein